MIEKFLESCLQPVIAAEKQLQRRNLISIILTVGAIAFGILIFLVVTSGWWSWVAVLGVLFGVVAAILLGLGWIESRQVNAREIARKVEESHPDLRAALLAAMDQKPAEDGSLSYLQRKLLEEVSEHAVKNRWVKQVSSRKLVGAAWLQFSALVLFGACAWILLGEVPSNRTPLSTSQERVSEKTPETKPEVSIAVSPGDVEIEKGSRLIVEATFSGRAPTASLLVLDGASGERRIPMTPGLDDTVFSALIPSVNESGNYRVAYESAKSDDFSITIFEYPELQQADATVTPPAYLDEELKEVTDTRKISIMEGSKVDWRLSINKPIKEAELYGEDGESIPLKPSAEDAKVLVASHVPDKTQKYRVHLVDDADRANKRPPWISITVKENVPPELKLKFPGRDYKVSALQELPLEAEVWDDVEVLRTGLSYYYNDKEETVELTTSPLAGNENHNLETLVDVETLETKPTDLISYHFWAEDVDKEGKVRRTSSDLFYANVRYFEDIVREGQPPSGAGAGQQPADELVRLQKDIVNASWKTLREHQLNRPFKSLANNVEVILESQIIVHSMAEEAMQQIEDAELRQIYQDARDLMQVSADRFTGVLEAADGEGLKSGHQAALDVYEKLLEAQSKERQIAMAKNPSQGSSQQERQENLNLELKQKDLKYEEKSQAEQATQSAEQKEDLAVLQKLKELARRQEAIAEKIKELQNQLASASEEERSEIERQLKRLQEEQRELLREVDDLSERMDSKENRSRMAEERKQLEETRKNIQEASEQMEKNDLADAANSATRATEKLGEMEEDFRQKTSNQFADEMRDLREASRRMVENQKAVSERLEEAADNQSDPDPFSPENRQEQRELAQTINEQSRALSDLMESMKTLSEESEISEPLLSDALYDTIRDAMTNGVEQSLEEARNMTFYNRPDQARSAEQAAARGMEEINEGIEKAAEKVLGNEADALRMARSELDRLIEQAREETERIAGEEGEPQGGSQSSEEEGESSNGENLAQQEGKGGQSPEEGKNQEGQKGKGKAKGEQGEGTEVAESGKAKGQSPGEGETEESGKGKGKGKEGQGKGEMAQGDTPGQGQGKGKEKGSTPGQGEGEGEQPGGSQKGKGKGDSQMAQGEGQGQQGGPSDSQQGNQGQQGNGSRDGQRRSGLAMGGDDRGGGLPTGGADSTTPLFFNQQSERRQNGPVTGEDYKEWAESLGSIEEMIPQEDIRNDIARVLDDARAMRIDYRRNNEPPAAATIQEKITSPLLELRERISEELAKMNKENPIAPIDRDPVPSEFRDLVRRYYEELGTGN
ncbi:MAG: hypothetical protein CMO55_23535 [Verrucomicrobiales bacterium]|nr:hypothetical protein [Verrucomicrobiales bacterium]